MRSPLRNCPFGEGSRLRICRKPDRIAIQDKLDGAAAKLGDVATPTSFAAADMAINSAQTALIRERTAQMKQRFQAASDQALAETSSDRIGHVVAEVVAQKPTSPQDRIAQIEPGFSRHGAS